MLYSIFLLFNILPSGNVLKELSEPAGAIIYCSRFKVNMEKDTFCSFLFYLAALFLSTECVCSLFLLF